MKLNLTQYIKEGFNFSIKPALFGVLGGLVAGLVIYIGTVDYNETAVKTAQNSKQTLERKIDNKVYEKRLNEHDYVAVGEVFFDKNSGKNLETLKQELTDRVKDVYDNELKNAEENYNCETECIENAAKKSWKITEPEPVPVITKPLESKKPEVDYWKKIEERNKQYDKLTDKIKVYEK